MSYFDGFVAAVPEARKEEYVAHARDAWERIFAPAGALRVLEAWGDDVPEGEVTSFPMAVKREPGEVVVFSFIEWPDRATRNACYARMRAGDEPEGMSEMPFDGRRMIYGGFAPVLVAAARKWRSPERARPSPADRRAPRGPRRMPGAAPRGHRRA